MAAYNFNFYLQEPQNDVKTNLQEITDVILYARRKQKLIKYRTPFKVLPSQWDSQKQEFKRNKVGYASINNTLGIIRQNAETYFYECLESGKPPTTSGLKERLDIELGLKIAEGNISFFQFIENFIKNSVVTKQAGTIKNYTTTFNHLKEFARLKFPSKRIEFDDVNMKFYNDFVAYCGIEKKMVLNSIGKNIKNLKVFMAESFDNELHQNKIYQNRKFHVHKEAASSIYLTEQELEMIGNLDLSKKPKLDKVRDIFLVGANTGLRFSDLRRLNKDMISGDYKHIKIVPTKTKGSSPEEISIGIRPFVKNIFLKYADDTNRILPRVPSNQKMNEYLKEIGKEAKINDPYKIDGKIILDDEGNEIPKYKMISSHTARRSFATNSYLRKIPTIDIMRVTNHKSESEFLKYIKVSRTEAADRVLAGWEKEKTK